MPSCTDEVRVKRGLTAYGISLELASSYRKAP